MEFLMSTGSATATVPGFLLTDNTLVEQVLLRDCRVGLVDEKGRLLDLAPAVRSAYGLVLKVEQLSWGLPEWSTGSVEGRDLEDQLGRLRAVHFISGCPDCAVAAARRAPEPEPPASDSACRTPL